MLALVLLQIEKNTSRTHAVSIIET